jgi:hypothetical protein
MTTGRERKRPRTRMRGAEPSPAEGTADKALSNRTAYVVVQSFTA